MSEVSLAQVVHLVEQLEPAEKSALLIHLQATVALPSIDSEHRTLEMILADHARLVASGAFDSLESLRNQYARPDLDLSFEEIQAYRHELQTAWKDEFDEFKD